MLALQSTWFCLNIKSLRFQNDVQDEHERHQQQRNQ